MSRCHAITKKGTACKAKPLKGTERCLAHADQKTRDTMSFGGAHGGRPKSPRSVDLIRERIEEDVDAWMRVLIEARDATKTVQVGHGDDAYTETVPDHMVRLAAFREAHDRAYGKPKQAVDVTSGDEPLSSSPLVVLDPELREQARALLRRAAGTRPDQSGGTGAGDE